jgi:excisionase family DNA binding protein
VNSKVTPQKYLTTGTAARLCGVSKVTILRYIEKGWLKSFKLPGAQNRILEQDFQEFAKRFKIPFNLS